MSKVGSANIKPHRRGRLRGGALGYVWWLLLCILGLSGCPKPQQVRRTPQVRPIARVAAKAPVRPMPRSVPLKRATPPTRRVPGKPIARLIAPRRVPMVRRVAPPMRPVVRRSTLRKRRRKPSRNAYFSYNAYRFYLRGQMHAVEGRGGKAIVAFKSALVYHPKSVFLRYRIARQFYKGKKYTKARFWALQAIKVRKKFASAYHLLGEIAYTRRKLKRAIRYYRSAIAKAPKDARGYLSLNKALQAVPGSHRLQSRILKQMIRHLPGRYEGYYHLAHLHQNQEQRKAAIRLYRSALNRKPSHHASLFQLANLYVQAKQWKQAARAYRVLLDYQPNAWQTRVTVACLYLRRGVPQDAQIAGYHFRYIMREATQFSAAERSYHIGSGLLQCGQYSHALRWLKQALKLRKNYSIARLALGMTYVSAGKPKASLVHFRSVSPKQRPTYVEAQLHLIQALLQVKQPKKAWLALERARIQLVRHPNDWIRLSQMFAERAPQPHLQQEVLQLRAQIAHLPHHKGLLHLLSFVYFKQKKYAKCEEVLKKNLLRHPKHSASLNFLGYLYSVLGRKLPEAERLARRALKLSPNNPYFLDTLGWVYYRQNQLKKARRVLEQALIQMPQDTTILLHLGRTYHRQRQWNRARKMYQKAQKLKPPPHLKQQIESALQKLKRRISVRATTIEL